MPKNTASKAKGTKAKAKALKDLKPSKAGATRGGATNVNRFDPYKAFKFHP